MEPEFTSAKEYAMVRLPSHNDLLSITKRHLHGLLESLGYRLMRVDALEELYDARNTGNDPDCKHYYTTHKSSILIDISLIDARNPFYYPLAPDGANPFVVAARHALASGDRRCAIEEVLRSYYDLVQPKNAAEYLGMETASDKLEATPPWGFVWPWEASTIEAKIGRSQRSKRRKAARNLGTGDLNVSHGWKFGGPVSPLYIHNEAMRLERLVNMVSQHGLVRHNGKDGDIVCAALQGEDGTWRWSISSGHHRAAVLSACGYTAVPARIRQIIRRRDVELWPNVVNGLFTMAEAIGVFDNVFFGVPPAIVAQWERRIENEGAPPKFGRSNELAGGLIEA